MNQTVKERYRIFLVEDDASIVDVLSRQLTRWNFDIYPIQDFENVLEEFYKCNPHLVLMDISLPFYDGYYWCHKIRQISKTPVVFLSSACDDLNQVMALNMGADDFIVKPFRLEFAVAKIQAMLRRTYTFGKNSDILFCGSISLNLNEAVLSFNDQQIELSKNEFRLMQILMEYSGKIVTREELIQKLWETENFIDDNTLTVNMARLRKRLEGIGLGNIILTKKGMGYFLEAPQ